MLNLQTYAVIVFLALFISIACHCDDCDHCSSAEGDLTLNISFNTTPYPNRTCPIPIPEGDPCNGIFGDRFHKLSHEELPGPPPGGCEDGSWDSGKYVMWAEFTTCCSDFDPCPSGSCSCDKTGAGTNLNRFRFSFIAGMTTNPCSPVIQFPMDTEETITVTVHFLEPCMGGAGMMECEDPTSCGQTETGIYRVKYMGRVEVSPDQFENGKHSVPVVLNYERTICYITDDIPECQ